MARFALSFVLLACSACPGTQHLGADATCGSCGRDASEVRSDAAFLDAASVDATAAGPDASAIDASAACDSSVPADAAALSDAAFADAGADAGSLCAGVGQGCAAGSRCCSSICDPNLLVCLAGTCGASGDPCATPEDCCSGSCTQAHCRPVASDSLDHNRNRVLDTLAVHQGAADRCALWAGLSDVQTGVFLTHTDMLGNRSCMENVSIQPGPLDPNNNCPTSSSCQCPPGTEMALDHLFKLWAINGNDPSCVCAETPKGYKCCNGGQDWHRMFFTADDLLVDYLRQISDGLPQWAQTNDPGGPHAPFTWSSETVIGQPRGQTHLFMNDSQAVALQRPGVVGVLDPHLVELDNDYNLQHDSNPEGCYGIAGHLCTYGRAQFKQLWDPVGDQDSTTFAGNGIPGPIHELATDDVWLPRCGPTVSSISDASGAKSIARGSVLVIRGSGFTPCADQIHCQNTVVIRTRSDSAVIADSSPFNLLQSADVLEVQLPAQLAAGEAFLYVRVGDLLSSTAPLTIAK